MGQPDYGIHKCCMRSCEGMVEKVIHTKFSEILLLGSIPGQMSQIKTYHQQPVPLGHNKFWTTIDPHETSGCCSGERVGTLHRRTKTTIGKQCIPQKKVWSSMRGCMTSMFRISWTSLLYIKFKVVCKVGHVPWQFACL